MYVRGSHPSNFNIGVGDAFLRSGVNLLPEPTVTKLLTLLNIETRRTNRVIISNGIRDENWTAFMIFR